MKIRSITAVGAVVLLGLTGCGGSDGPSVLSEDDFIDEMGDICSDTESDLDRIADPESLGDLEDTAEAATEILTETRERLSQIAPPEDLAADFADFVENVDDQLAALDDLAEAGRDDDEEAADEAFAELGQLSERRSELGDDLGVDECVNDDDTDDTTVPAAEAPTTAVPAETVVPLTLPATLPPQTAAPETALPDTTPTSGQLFSIVDLTTIFVAPEGFTLVNSDPAAAQGFIDIVAGVPELNSGVLEMGVGVLLDETGQAIATIVVGVAVSDAMPGQWKDLLCGTDGILRTSASGFTGIACPGAPDTGVSEIFTLTQGDLGLSVASLLPSIPADLVADAFFEANL